MRVVVTGGAGFIGGNLCRTLLATAGVDRVTVLDDLSTGSADNIDGLDLHFVRGSITDPDAIDQAFDGADAVVHLAALGSVPRSVIDPVASHAANTNGTLMVLEGARRHGGLHTIVASSSSVYGANPTLPKHEGLATRPMSPYAATKLATESYSLAWQQAYGMPTLAFRFFNVFGPLQPAGHAYAAVIPSFIDAALRGVPLTVHGDGTQSRDFTYVDTVAAVLTDAVMRKVVDPEPINLAYGSRITLLEVIEQLEAMLGRPLAREHTPTRAGDVPHSQADSSRVRALFGHVVPTPFTEGLSTTVQWMQSVAG
jgi:UDP-glucose 4-epimerase